MREELRRIYAARFSGLETYRNQVWRVLTADFFSRRIKPGDAVLDLGCGYGEFINNIEAAERFAMDLNPAAKDHVLPFVELFEQDCSSPWPIEDGRLDAVFTSNFLEHLPSKAALRATLTEAHRCLRVGGQFIALGPNIRYVTGHYWDFFDHQLCLTDMSVSELLLMTGFEVEQAIPRFLPYTMSQGSRPPAWSVRLYLKIPFAWRFLGRQFLVIGRKVG
jgi:SAM-dependent methyltransferase